MSFQVISDRLATLQESNAQLKDLIDRLANLRFQPGSVPLNNDDGNIISELAVEIQQTLKEQGEDFENLQEEVYGQQDKLRKRKQSEEEIEHLDVKVKTAIKELESYEKYYRRSYLQAKRNLEAARKQERQLLLQSYLEPSSDTSSPVPGQPRRKIQNKELSKEEREINASSNVTAAMRRTHDMMTAELSRSQFAREALQESSAELKQLTESYNTMDTLLANSRNLLGTLLRSQKSDTWYLESAFYILLATIGWLIFRRFLYGPLWWFAWFPMKMFFGATSRVLTTMGVFAGSTAGSSVSSIVASQSVIHNSATRRPMPTISGARAPNVNVGGGGRGAPMQQSATPQSNVPESPGETMSEQVGKIIDDSQSEATTEEQTREKPSQDQQDVDPQVKNLPNPKKRMWEEPVEAEKQAQRKKDEL